MPRPALLHMEYVFAFFEPEMFGALPAAVPTVEFPWEGDGRAFAEAVRAVGAELLVGNIPATAYDRIAEAAKELPGVRFLPSLELQRLNRSKEEVVRFCREHAIPHPETHIFANRDEGEAWLKAARYPLLLRRSYGPSNFGGYHSREVASPEAALEVLRTRRYFDPVFVQEPVRMRHGAEFRVILLEHEPLQSYWHAVDMPGELPVSERPGNAMELAVRVSKACNAPYLLCSIAVDAQSGEALLLECTTAFAAPRELREKIAKRMTERIFQGA